MPVRQGAPASNTRRTITALTVAVSALGFSGMISLDQYVFISRYVFTVKIVPQVWRIFTAFLITKPKFGILLDPYFLYQYGSGLERESSRFAQPGDFFMYTMFVGSAIVVSLIFVRDASFTSDYLPAQLDSMVEAVPEPEEEYPCTSRSSVIRII
jgi:Derlin-2/3